MMFAMILVKAVVWLKTLEDVTLMNVGVKATFECQLSVPASRVEWYRTNKKLRPGDKYDMVADGCFHRLTVHNVTTDDVAQYSAVYEKLSTAASLQLTGKLIPAYGCILIVYNTQ